MEPKADTFEILLLIARPAAGKSEVIDYLKRTPLQPRKERFHILDFEEIDDFPMLWTWFEEDYLLEKMGFPRLHTDKEGYFLWDHLWDVLIERISLEYQKKTRDPAYAANFTTIIEFSRGKEHGGFASAFQHLSEDILRKSAIIYINVSWEQSLLKNRRRFNPNRPDSILEHGLPDEKLERLYRYSDWDELASGSPQYLNIKGIPVPYVVFENEDDVTTARDEKLGVRLEDTLGKLWALYKLK